MANECIPLYRPGQDISARCDGNVKGKTLVKIVAGGNAATGELCHVNTAAAGDLCWGVAAYDQAAGKDVAVINGPGHVVPITASAAIGAGVEVQAAANGQVAVLAAGKRVGVTWSAATAAGQDVFVRLD